jgi:flagellar protein FliO/FliZ
MEAYLLLKAFLALFAIAAFILLLGVLGRKYNLAAKFYPQHSKRLSVEETLIIDAKRRIILVKCDGNEHLLMLGSHSDMVLGTMAHKTTESHGGI